jgi:hypothetical protein
VDTPKPKFIKEELVQIAQKYRCGLIGLVINTERHEMTGDAGWYTFVYHVLTDSGNIIEITESSLSKIHTSSSADTK